MQRTTSKIYKNPKGNTMYLRLPSKLVMDSLFPFNIGGEDVVIEIIGDRIIVYKSERDNNDDE